MIDENAPLSRNDGANMDADILTRSSAVYSLLFVERNEVGKLSTDGRDYGSTD
jgi:hypothetical protein